ncbi:Cytochrome c oxidase subunit CcoO [Methylophaga frappieri]|uniref:Cytochrome c oxidase subunit CcoO n=1 Tax=Methylophaga frappieri (strain ATCC BAA-2434 / DSM 25690 / JAM7) TaxID=754477 RepID=I1YFE0_METFJ|nr:cytochrome-c oxidase, cbb3-type subunit II [Methylophaga frappieri]AFJ01633.1 Cytochrome c oxidase subunit CcoO [Methylophaga frappieri]
MAKKLNKRVSFQEWVEQNVWGLVLATALVVSVGGIVEIVPLFYLDTTFEDDVFPEYEELKGVRPYTALELAGRDIYQREGCYLCHSQMVRPFRDEKDRYGHYSLAVESKYDHPFQWGSKRTGPDLARVGGKYSDAWHIQHLRNPRSVVPESIMPNYPWLDDALVNPDDVEKRVRAMRVLGVPYSDEDILGAAESVEDKTEMEALVAYLQVLGTMVKFEPGRDYRE